MRYFAGIDVAKREHQMVILNEGGVSFGKAQRIANTREGFTACVNALQQLDGTVEVALEATGPY